MVHHARPDVDDVDEDDRDDRLHPRTGRAGRPRRPAVPGTRFTTTNDLTATWLPSAEARIAVAASVARTGALTTGSRATRAVAGPMN